MRDARVQLTGLCAAVAILLQCGAPAMAWAASWWPSATVFSQPAPIGLAANGEGGFLLVDGGGPSRAASCAPAGATFALGGPGPRGEVPYPVFDVDADRVIPGSPSFEPGGRSVALYLWRELGLHGEYVQQWEGPSRAPAALVQAGPLGSSAPFTTTFARGPAVMSATGPLGTIAVAAMSEYVTTIAVRPAGSTEWSRDTVPAGAQGGTLSQSPKALAVDGFGDTTVLVNTVEYQDEHVEIVASAYFAPPGGSFTPLAVPGSYFTAIASDAAGRSAIAGYTSSGPDGPGLYLSRRESPYAPFGPPVLLSSLSSDPRPQLAYAASGVLTVAWNEGSRVAVATAEPGEPVGPAQGLSAPGATVASEEQLSVDAAGEAILAWSGGPHEEFFALEAKLNGIPAAVFATVRHSASEPFQAVQELGSSALYSEGLYSNGERSSEARAVDAIGSGRAMVAWLEQDASGPEVKTAVYAGRAGCASPPPVITAASLTNRRFRVSKQGTAISASKASLGTTLRFTLSTTARLQITVTRSAAGRLHGHRCLAPTAELKRVHARQCVRTLTVGTLSRASAAEGPDSVPFSGRIGHRALAAGPYRATLLASDALGRSRPVALGFTVVR